jgi:UDP-3-O-[3-hydroxymyristoyl] glucosamine N-acyltransferase
MVQIQEIINLLNIEETRLVNTDISIKEMIQANAQNEREDVIMWVSEKNTELISAIKKGTVICPKVEDILLQKEVNYIFTDNPRRAFRLVLEAFFSTKQEYHFSKKAKIPPSVKRPKNAFIGDNVVIEMGCELGENIVIGHNTVIHARTIIKNNVKIGCNCVIGSEGFGYEKDEKGSYVFIPHIGNVVLEDNVEIGNCTVIDRAVIGSTRLRKNVKVDNLVHIAHGVDIGENSLIIAHSMVGGSTKIGGNVWVSPASAIMNKIEIGDNAVIGLGAVVVKSVENEDVVVGNPARSIEKKNA